MNSPATGSLYSVVTFVLLVAAFALSTHHLLGWAMGPSDNRLQASLTVLWYVGAGYYAMQVGRHRGVTYLVALRRAAIDVGRSIKATVLR